MRRPRRARPALAVAVHFKGSGFYNTDYGKKKSGAPQRRLGEGSGESKAPSRARSSSELEVLGLEVERLEVAGDSEPTTEPSTRAA